MKHIYLISKGSRASQYGIGTYLREVMKCLKDDPLLCLTLIELQSEVKEFVVDYDESGKIRILRFPFIYILSQSQEKRWARNVVYVLKSYIDIQNVNVFHFNFQLHYLLATCIKEYFPESKMVMTIHYMDWCFELKGNIDKFHKITQSKGGSIPSENEIYISFLEEKLFFEKMDYLFCLSQYTKQVLIDDYDIPYEKIWLVYNGLQDERGESSKQIRLVKKNYYGFSEKQKIILFVGRLDEIKGVDYLILAFREIIKVEPNAHLLIVGDGNYNVFLNECEDLWTRMTFTGKIDKKKLYDFYQIADVGVMPSFHEQCSYVAIEMMMHGLALVGTASTGLSEMLQPEYRVQQKEIGGTYGINVRDLVHKVIKILNDENEKTRMEMISRQTFVTKYNLDRMNAGLKACYNRL
ncbi:TIGR04157 family glycosyltransferase [Bacteroides fragilis]